MKRDLYDQDHETLRQSVRTFVERSILPNTHEHVLNKSIPRELWLEAGKHGFLGLEIPEEHGGSEARDFRFNAIIAEEFAKAGASYSAAFGMHADVVAPYLVLLGREEKAKDWLPKVASGELILSIGMSEPSGGSDLAALKTTAERDGRDWVINGSKTFITNGFSCDLVLVAARTSPGKGARGITLFAVESTRPGFVRGNKLDKVGMDESDTAELFFDNVRVSENDLIGEVDQGFIHMMQHLPQERLIGAVANVAHAKQILLETLEYCKQRHVFGQPVGSHQYNKFLLADLFTRIEIAETFVDRCVLAHSHGKLDAITAAKAKLWSSQVQGKVLDHCVQLHGGYGYINEFRVARAWRDARVTRIWGGSNEIMKEIIGRDLGL